MCVCVCVCMCVCVCVYIYIYEREKSFVVSSEVDTVTRVQFLNDDICISSRANNLWKGMNPTILSPAVSK